MTLECPTFRERAVWATRTVDGVKHFFVEKAGIDARFKLSGPSIEGPWERLLPGDGCWCGVMHGS